MKLQKATVRQRLEAMPEAFFRMGKEVRELKSKIDLLSDEIQILAKELEKIIWEKDDGQKTK